MNISRKLLLVICIASLTMQFSWSQSITITSYACTGAGSANLALTSNTGITSYAWKNATTNVIVATTPTTTQSSGSYSVTYIKGGFATTVGPFTVAIGIVPTASTVTPSTASTPLCGVASSSQTLTSSTVSNYSWNRNGVVLSPAVTTNSLSVLGNSVAAGTYNYSVTTTNTVTNCTATSNAVAITILAKPGSPVISPSTLSTPICGSSTQTLTASNIGSAVYVWKRDGVTLGSTTNSIVVTGTDVPTEGTYNYTVSSQNSSGCVSDDSAPVALKISPKPATPTITAANSTNTLCGASTQTLTASGGGSSYVWRRGNTILSTTSNSLTVSGNDATGTFLFTAALVNSVGCVSDISSGVSLTLSPATAAPSITTPSITTPICGTSTQILTASSGGTTYIWKRAGVIISGSTNTITVTGNDVTVGDIYNYTVATENSSGCVSSESAPFSLKVSPKPVTPIITPATFTPNVICNADFKTLTATSGETSYTWKRGGVAVTGSTTNLLNVVGTDVTVGGTYVYTVSVTNSVGCVSDDSQTGVTLQLFPTSPPKPTITANDKVVFCEGGNVILNYNRGITSDVKIWSRTSGIDTTTTNTDGITVRSTNTFTVKTKDANSCLSPSSNPFLVTVNLLPAKPIIDKGISDAICETDSITISVNNKGTGNYLWNTGKTTTSITVRIGGSYSLTYTDANLCTSLPSLPFVLTINPLPAKPTILNLNKNEFCYREFTSLKASSTTSGATFQWDYLNSAGKQIDVAGSSKKTQDEIIKISVRAVSVFSNSSVNNSCKSKESSDFITITVYPLPTTPNITVSGPITFCPDSTVSLTSTESPNGVYRWINTKDNSEFSDKKTVLIDTTSKYFNSSPLGKIGKFYVRTISNRNCASDTSKNVTITVRDAPQPASILSSPISAAVCEGGTVTLKALVANGNVKTYSWRDEATQNEVSTEQDVLVSKSGTFSIRVRDTFGCFAANSKVLKVTISPLPIKPIISIVKAKTFCDEDSTIVQSSFPSTTMNGNKNVYRWIVDGQTVLESTSRTFSWKKASTISVAVTDSNGCKALTVSDTIRTTVNPLPTSPAITVRGAIPFCADKSVILSAVGTNDVSYKWSTGAITANINTNVAGNVTVQAVNGFGCLSKPSQVVQVRVNALPIAPKLTANGETTFCEGSKVRIISSSLSQAYWWRSTTDSVGKGDDLSSIFASKTGNYFAKVQDNNGCISLASAPIAVDARPNPTPTVIKQIGTFTLDAQGVGDENGYIWRLNDVIKPELTTRIIKAKQDGNYKVQASIFYTGLAIAGGKLVCYSNTSNAIKYVQDLTFNGFSVFPNPSSSGEINVEVIEDLIGANLAIYDLYGQLIIDYKVDKFNTLKKIQLPNSHGNTYIVKLVTDGFDRTRKVIILK